jgi:hypothetical protein
MSPTPFGGRFAQLEIPEEKKRLDWSFLDSGLALPSPLPLEAQPIFALVNGRFFLPAKGAPAPGRSLILYDREHALVEADSPGKQEAAWLEGNATDLKRQRKRFFNAVPPAILNDPLLVKQAIDILEASTPTVAHPDEAKAVASNGPSELAPLPDNSLIASRLTGWSRLLRIHQKLYDLVTLKEYMTIFEKAVEPAAFRNLQSVPDRASPDEVLAKIEASLEAIHAKARSPMRNKMKSSRVVFNGVTLLPMYREPAQSLFEAISKLLERTLQVEALQQKGGR